MTMRLVTTFFTLTVGVTSLCVTPLVTECEAQPPFRPKLLGGDFENLQLRPIAYISSPFGSCTGTLVGKDTLLTAAHCLPPGIAANDFGIKLGGESYGVRDGYHPASFNHALTTMRNSRFDVAILLLDREVTALTPYPILKNDAVKKNEQGRMFGYGLNERADPGPDLSLNGKSAAAVVHSLSDGVITTNLNSSQGAVCSGDSGGPLTQTITEQIAVVGVTSTGSSVDVGLQCVRNGATVSNFVDLQSRYARAFLAQFPNIQYVSGAVLKSQPIVRNLKKSLAEISSQSKISQIHASVKTAQNLTGQLSKILTGNDLKAVQSCAALLRKARTTKSVSSAKAHVSKANQALNKLSFPS